MWRVWLSVLLVGCASQAPYRDDVDAFFVKHPSSTKNPPNVLGVGPWTLGRWATYSRIGEHGARGFDRITIVAVDACGTWVEDISLDVDQQHRLLVCVQPSTSSDPLDIVREVRFQGGEDLPSVSVDVAGDRAALRQLVGPLVAKLVPRTRAVGLGGEEHDLVEWGEGATRSVVSSLANRGTTLYMDRGRRGTSYLSIGAGVGYVGGSSRFDGEQLASFSFGAATAITPRLDLIANVALGSTSANVADGAMDQAMDQTFFSVAPGVRSRPWSPRVFLEVDVGYAEIELHTTTLARGATASGAIGVDVALYGGWRWSLEARGRALLLTNDEGLRSSLVVAGLIGLDLR